MSDKMAGSSEAYIQGYEAAIQDMIKEIDEIRCKFQSLSLPIIERIMNKLEDKNDKDA